MIDGGQDHKWKEKRQADRWYLVFYLRVFDGMSRKILGHLIDISEKGIMLICDDPVEVNEDYRLRMRLPNQMKERDEIIFSATSRWCKSDVNPDFFLVGFQIYDLDPTTTDLINNLIKDFSYNDKR
ncbi:MAG: PilZ domain-containing protein [Desulfobulbaceae bacterium]|nr:PilZ domain-containing protein [Desulfobulbaceae bacterium]